jgi:phosphoserine phosphatase RsbU/P
LTLQLDAGTTLVAYTDGITEAQREGEGRFGLGRLREALGQLGGTPPAELMDGLAATLEQFRSGTHTDDTAAIALHRVAGGIEDRGRAEGYAAAAKGTIASTPA